MNQENRNMIPLNAAGAELLLSVFNHLNKRDWYNAERVCSWWFFLLNDCWFQADTFHASTLARFCNRKLVNFITKRRFQPNPWIPWVFKFKYSKTNTRPFNFEDIKEFAPGLRYLNLKGFELCMIDSFFVNSHLRTLKELTLRVGVFVQCKQIEQLLVLNPLMEELCLIGHYCREENPCLLMLPQKLHILSYQRCHMWFEDLDIIFSRWSSLRYFRIDICDNVTNELIDNVLEYLPCLHAFSCNFVKRDDEMLSTPYREPKKKLHINNRISIITLINNSLFNDAMLSTILQTCDHLEHLYVGFLPFEANFGSNFTSMNKTDYKMDRTKVVFLQENTLNKILSLKHLRNLCLYGVTVKSLTHLDPITNCKTIEVLAIVSVYFNDASDTDTKKPNSSICPKISFEHFISKAIIKITTLVHVILLGEKYTQRGLEIAKAVVISDDDIIKESGEQLRKRDLILEIEEGSVTREQLSMFKHPRLKIIQTTVAKFVDKWEEDFFSCLSIK